MTTVEKAGKNGFERTETRDQSDAPQGMVRVHHREHKKPAGFFLTAFSWLTLAVGLIYLASAQLELRSQLYLSGALLAGMFVMKLRPQSRAWRLAFLGLSSFIVLRYFLWRSLYTVEFTDWVSFACALILFLAEAYGILIFFLGNFVNISPITRTPVPLPAVGKLPTVDVYVPSYNESPELLEVTLLAALQMRYPAEKKKVFLLDDGGTDQRCASSNEEVRKSSIKRRETLQALCASLGANYLTRKANRGAKAGNLNEAFHKTDGELVVIFDADHVPTEDFLEKTVGLFAEDAKLFLVQTPHFFVNPDPIERNLDTFKRMPSENEMFYRVIQKGLDFWNSAFFCGSGAVMRRKYLAENGGLAGDTITEDAETALTLHSRGYNSAYISTPLLSGLAPDTMGAFITQRIRWATGMVQIFLLKCPLFLRGLSLPQRLCYLNSCIFWFFPFARCVYLLAPVAFLFFGLKIYAANWQTFCAYVVPHLFAVLTVSNYLYGKVRWSFVSELYELIQSIYTMPAILATFLNPRAPKFNVTPKGEQLSKDFVSPLAFPFYVLAAINLATVGIGISFLLKPGIDIYPVAITLGWSLFNTVILLAALGALLERRQRRAAHRMPANVAAELVLGDAVYPCRVLDLSLGGCKLSVRGVSESMIERCIRTSKLRVFANDSEPMPDFHLILRNVRDAENGGELCVGAEFDPETLEERKAKVRLVAGSSERWMNFQLQRESRLGVLGSLFFLAYLGVKHSVRHAMHLIGSGSELVTGQRAEVQTRTLEA